MKIYQPSRARSHEQLLTRIWACANGVDVSNMDDMHECGDTFQLGDAFMGPEHWEAFRVWKVARGLFSAAAIQQYLKQHDFLPWQEDAVDEGGYRQMLIEGAVYLMGEYETPVNASYRDGVWHLEGPEARGHFVLDDAGHLWSVGAIDAPTVQDDILTLRYCGMARDPELALEVIPERDVPFDDVPDDDDPF